METIIQNKPIEHLFHSWSSFTRNFYFKIEDKRIPTLTGTATNQTDLLLVKIQ
jgi:hypothetical protein